MDSITKSYLRIIAESQDVKVLDQNTLGIFLEKEICDAIDSKQLISFVYKAHRNRYGDRLEYKFTALPVEIYYNESHSLTLKAYKDGIKDTAHELNLTLENIIGPGKMQKAREEVLKQSRYIKGDFKNELTKAVAGKEMVRFWLKSTYEECRSGDNTANKVAVLPVKIIDNGDGKWTLVCYKWGLTQPVYMIEASDDRILTYEEVLNLEE